MKKTGWLQILCAVALLFGVTGCMIKDEKKMTKNMLQYVEQKYGEEFTAELFDKGDILFPELYGDDRLIVSPLANQEVAFWVFKESKGYSDNYMTSYFSHQFNTLHKAEILSLVNREMDIQFALNFSNLPQEEAMSQRTVEEIVSDEQLEGYLYLYIAIPESEKLQNTQEAQFLYEVYGHVKKMSNREFLINVAYIQDAYVEDAQRLLRYSPILNFDWSLLQDEAVVKSLAFGSNSVIEDAAFFNERIK